MRRKNFIILFGVILAGVFSGIALRLITELHFNDEGSYVSHQYEEKLNENAAENGVNEIENVTLSEDISFDTSIDNDLSFPAENKNPAYSSTTKSRNRNINIRKQQLSGYEVIPRKTGKDELIPRKNTPIRYDKNNNNQEMYFNEMTQKNYMTMPTESIDIKKIWR